MSNTAVNTDLLLTFFLTFSKFEHALKASGFFKKPRNGNYNSQRPTPAEPDWDSFAVSLRKCFAANRKEKLAMACDYLLLSPPKKQVIIRVGQKWYIAWEPPARSQNETDIEFLLKMIRGIRNNLFHGGKHNAEVHEDTQRTEQLLNASIAVLGECLELAPQVRMLFDRATL